MGAVSQLQIAALSTDEQWDSDQDLEHTTSEPSNVFFSSTLE